MEATIHEMRNHLTVAMAGIEACIDRKFVPTDVRLNAIFAALSAVDRLIDDLPRDRTATFGLQVVPFDVCGLIANQVVAMEGFAASRAVRLTIAGCTPSMCTCAKFTGDPVRIAQIITNILINAVRYTPRNGKVQVVYSRDRAHLSFSVSDEGPGIERAERTRIFERGYRTASAAPKPGSGLGLGLVKQFVDQHGGTIVVSDGPLCGATFTVTLSDTFAVRETCLPAAASRRVLARGRRRSSPRARRHRTRAQF